MKPTVLPDDEEGLSSRRTQNYKKMTCATCHGDGATTGQFKMPNPSCPSRPQPTSRDDFVELEKKKPDA